MALGTEIADVLPFLRRYGRAALGSQKLADTLVTELLKAIAANPASFDRSAGLRVALYRDLQRLIEGRPHLLPNIDSEDFDADQSIADIRLGSLKEGERAALLLTQLEGFSTQEAGQILGVSERDVERAVVSAIGAIEEQTRARVLIIEDEPIIAMDLESIVRSLGHEVISVAETHQQAVDLARKNRPDLILADIQLADDSSGIEAIREILAERIVPTIFITAFPERLLTVARPEPTFLITKPFRRSSVVTAISQALFFDTSRLPSVDPSFDVASLERVEPDANEPTLAEARRELRSASLEPRPGPLQVEMVGEQMRVARAPIAVAPIGLTAISAVRQLHLRTAERLCSMGAGYNLGEGFTARLLAIKDDLISDLTESTALQLGIQARGIQSMETIIRDELTSATAEDIITLASDLVKLACQFPIFREYEQEARSFGLLSREQRLTVARAAQAIEALPEDTVSEPIKEELGALRQDAEIAESSETDLAFVRGVANGYLAWARFLRDRLNGISDNALKSFDKVGGGAIGAVIATIIVVAPTLYLLAEFMPNEFGFVIAIAKLAKTMIP